VAVYDEEKEKLASKKPTPNDPANNSEGQYSSGEQTESEQKSVSGETLKEAETNPTSGSSTKESPEEDGLYSGEDPDKPASVRLRSTFTRKRLISGGLAGLLIGGGFGLLTITSGPLQFVHISQLLQRFHFASIQDNSDSRVLKLYKYAKNARQGTVENTRLGVLEKKIAVNFDSRLKDIGIQKNYADTFGAQYQGITVDQEKFTERSPGGDEYKGLGREEFKARFAEKNNVHLIDGPNNTLIATTDEIGGVFKNRTFNSMLAEESGYGKVTGAIATRIMGKRDGLTWHPIKKLDAKIRGTIDEKFSAWVRELRDNIKKGASPGPILDASAQETTGADGKPTTSVDNIKGATGATGITANATAAAAEAEASLEKGANVTDNTISQGFISKISESTTGKGILGGTALIGLVCAVKALGKNIDGIRHDLVVLPLIRTGMQAVSLGNQVMSGQDISSEQLGFFAKELNDPTGGSWASAKSIQAELGQDTTGKDIPKAASIKNLNANTFLPGFLGDALSSAPVNITCEFSDSVVGQTINYAIGALTPVATLGSFAISQTSFVKNGLASLVGWLAGSPIPTMVFGPDYGNYINYGARLASNDSAVSMGGIKLTSGQSAALKENRANYQNQEFASESFAQKVLNPYSPDSLVGKAIDTQSSSVTTNVANIFSSIINPSTVLKSFSSVFTRRANAATATNYDYGFPEVGFSLSDLDSKTYDDPYDNATQVLTILSGANGQKYIDRAKTCFGITLTVNGDASTDFAANIDTLKNDYPSDCADPSPEWTRIRFYVLDTKTAEAADCYGSGDTQSCAGVGFGNAPSTTTTSTAPTSGTIVGDITQSSVDVPCAAGTNDVGVRDGYSAGGLVKIRLCAVPNLPSSGEESTPGTSYYINGANSNAVVNSRVSGAWLALVTAAKAASINISAQSSFRTIAHQQYLCSQDARCSSGDYTAVAKPGTSNHQMGLAIDFSDSNQGTTKKCVGTHLASGRCIAPGDPTWEWLNKNAVQFGFSQYVNESWHWSPNGK
jgi:hypothetical protein